MSPTLEAWSDGDSPVHPLSAIDFLPRSQLQEMQLYRLQTIVRWAYQRVSLFRERMQERGLTPDAIRDLHDIRKLPFSAKADLHATYPFGLFACSMEEIVRLHASSGTKSKPIVVAYTQKDLEL